jgi:hypothetical protein
VAASYDPDPRSSLGSGCRSPSTPARLSRNAGRIGRGRTPVVAIETQANNLRRLKAFYIDCGEKDQFNLLYSTVPAGSRAGSPSWALRIAMRNSPGGILIEKVG